jgi:hypothetical protein
MPCSRYEAGIINENQGISVKITEDEMKFNGAHIPGVRFVAAVLATITPTAGDPTKITFLKRNLKKSGYT